MGVSGQYFKLTAIFRWFNYFITASIILNSISLALYDYTDRESVTKRN